VPDRPERADALGGLVRDALASRQASTGRRELAVLDVGGGTGLLAVPLARSGHRVTVVDPTLDALAMLERRAAEAGLAAGSIAAIQGDAADLAHLVEPGSVDLVLCHNVIEVVDDPAAALAGVAATLERGGVLSLLAANRHAVVLAKALAGRVDEARHALADPFGRWGDADPVPRRFTMDQLQLLVAQSGLVADAVHGVRVFADLVPGRIDAAQLAELGALEASAANHPAFRELAVHLHVRAHRV